MGKIWDRLFKQEQVKVNEMRADSGASAGRGIGVSRNIAMVLKRGPILQYDARFRAPRMDGHKALRELEAFRRDIRSGRLSHAQLERWIDQNWTDDNLRTANNIVTTEGVNALITCFFKNTAQPAAWYVACMKGAGAPTLVIGDTAASHAGWTEIAGTDVSEGTRQAFTAGAVAAGSVDNSAAKARYTGAALWTAQGLAMMVGSAFASTTAPLYSEATFTEGSAAMQTGYLLDIQATVSVTAG
jgi:hypothetical protein